MAIKHRSGFLSIVLFFVVLQAIHVVSMDSEFLSKKILNKHSDGLSAQKDPAIRNFVSESDHPIQSKAVTQEAKKYRLVAAARQKSKENTRAYETTLCGFVLPRLHMRSVFEIFDHLLKGNLTPGPQTCPGLRPSQSVQHVFQVPPMSILLPQAELVMGLKYLIDAREELGTPFELIYKALLINAPRYQHNYVFLKGFQTVVQILTKHRSNYTDQPALYTGYVQMLTGTKDLDYTYETDEVLRWASLGTLHLLHEDQTEQERKAMYAVLDRFNNALLNETAHCPASPLRLLRRYTNLVIVLVQGRSPALARFVNACAAIEALLDPTRDGQPAGGTRVSSPAATDQRFIRFSALYQHFKREFYALPQFQRFLRANALRASSEVVAGHFVEVEPAQDKFSLKAKQNDRDCTND